MEEKKLVPKKRFKGFEQHWGLYQFDTKFNVVSGNAFKLNEYISSGVPIINGESIQNGFVKSNNIHYLPKNYLERFESIKLLKGDIVLGLNRTIINNKLKISLVPYTLNESLLYQRAGKIINIKKIHQYFSYRLLEKHIYQFVLKEAVGSDQPFISTNILKETTIIIPTEEMEQQKIGEFFKVLDERIANQERKIVKVKALKEAYLTEMFPQEGETVPKRRFKGFEGEWTREVLGELAIINTGNSDVKDAVENGIYPFFIRSKNIAKSDTYTYEGEAILIPGEGKLGEVYHYYNGKFNYHQRVYKISDFENNVSGQFVYYSMMQNFKEHALKETVKATVDSLRLPTITSFSVLLPNYKEQQKIGVFFKNLDDQIHAEDAKLEKLKKMKEAYLEEMFV